MLAQLATRLRGVVLAAASTVTLSSCIPVREHRLDFAPSITTVAASATLRVGIIPGTAPQESPNTVAGPYDVFFRYHSSSPGVRLRAVESARLRGVEDSALVQLRPSRPERSTTREDEWVARVESVPLRFQDYDLTAVLILETTSGETDTLNVSGTVAKRRASNWAFWPWSFMST